MEYFGLRPLPQVSSFEDEMLMQSLVSALIDAIWSLLHIHQSAIRQHDETEDTKHRLADDNKNLRVCS